MQKKQIVAIIITGILLALIFYKIDWANFIETFKLFNLKQLCLIVPVYISTLYLRGIRWKSLLMSNKKYNALHLGEVFTVGSMLNIFLPARGGDIYRAYYLGKNKSEKKMKIFGSIILERTLDGICVFMILLAAVLNYSRQNWIENLAYLIGAIFIGSLLIFYLMFKFNKVDYICAKCEKFCKKLPNWISHKLIGIIHKLNYYINSFIEGFESLNSLKYSAEAFIMSMIIWGIECYVAYLIINSFALSLGFGAALFVISLISFSTMLPSTSVFLGPYQYAYVLALGIFGIDKSTALAVSTVHQAILVLILSAIGFAYLWKFNISIKEIKESEHDLIEQEN